MAVDITEEEYARIMIGSAKGLPFREIEGIENALEKMAEAVKTSDRYMNLDNSYRKTALKKPREISCLEFYLPENEIIRIKRIKNPEEMFTLPTEQMTIHRSDGSTVFIKYEYGRVMIKDAHAEGTTVYMDVEHFLSRLGL